MDLKTQLIGFEGSVPHAYQDHLGFWTIGVGRLIDKRKGGLLSPDEIEYLLDNDIRRTTQKVIESFPWASKLNEPRLAVLVNMAFQMGIKGLMGFTGTTESMRAGRYSDAAEGMRRSLWARQTPDRARRLALQMETGDWR